MPEDPPNELMRDRMMQADFDRVLAWLRKVDSADRVSFINRWSHFSPPITRLATSAVNHSGESLAIARAAFEAMTHADSQRTKCWCKFAVTKLGPLKALRLLREFIESRPHVVDMACYWLPTMIARDSSAYPELKSLSKDADKAGIIRPPVISKGPDGSVQFHDRYEGTYPKS